MRLARSGKCSGGGGWYGGQDQDAKMTVVDWWLGGAIELLWEGPVDDGMNSKLSL